MYFLHKSTVESRNIKLAILSGLFLGFLSTFTKWGYGHPFPPFEVGMIAPPVQIAVNWLGFDKVLYTWLGHPQVSGMIVHGALAIAFGVFYVVAAEYFPRITYAKGIGYGMFIFLFFHGFQVPLFGFTPWLWDMSWKASFSEIFSHILTYYTLHEMMCAIRYRVMGAPLASLATYR